MKIKRRQFVAAAVLMIKQCGAVGFVGQFVSRLNKHEKKTIPPDLSDAGWQILEPLTPPPKHGGRPRKVSIREVVNAMVSTR